MTSNIGSQYYANGRIDDIVIFHNLDQEHLAGTVGIQLNRFADRLAAQGIAFSDDDGTKLLLAEKGYDPVHGARPLNALLKVHY
jgi:ATP-dependent Clp protease ATP-binding subunit ClpA